tara:strand:- start:145 stop:714 length:570 start_codon:yes stop_codon:yes gene_type:complete
MFMDWNNIKAAAVKINVDDSKLTQELEAIPKELWDSGEDLTSNTSWNTIWIRTNSIAEFTDFKLAKGIDHSEWEWREDLTIPYIKSLVESLPIRTIGMIRAFILTGPLPIHTDSNESTPKALDYNLALTIASKLEVPMTMTAGTKVKEKTIFFNDSIPHGFPDAVGTQMSIRVFGDFEYDKFEVDTVYE